MKNILQIIAANRGDICGEIKYVEESLIFGGKILVEPNSRFLKPGQCGVFVISFTSNRQGDFLERVSFKIVESNEIISIIIKGRIVSPTLHFDVRQIDFGKVAFGIFLFTI